MYKCKQGEKTNLKVECMYILHKMLIKLSSVYQDVTL